MRPEAEIRTMLAEFKKQMLDLLEKNQHGTARYKKLEQRFLTLQWVLAEVDLNIAR